MGKLIKPDSENEIQASFFYFCDVWLNKYPELELLHSIPNGSHKSRSAQKIHKMTGLKSGVPDVCLPVARCGFNGFYIEFKSAKGRLSLTQKWWHQKLADQGYLVTTCHSVEDAINITLAYVSGKKTRLQELLTKLNGAK
jgi:hypothetical protein